LENDTESLSFLDSGNTKDAFPPGMIPLDSGANLTTNSNRFSKAIDQNRYTKKTTINDDESDDESHELLEE